MAKGPDWRKLDDLIADPNQCGNLLNRYFGTLSLTSDKRFTGSEFEPSVAKLAAWPAGTDSSRRMSSPSPCCSVNVPPRAALYLLADQADTLSAALTQLLN